MKRTLALLLGALLALPCVIARPAWATLTDTSGGRRDAIANGVATVYTFSFPVVKTSDVQVTVTLAGVVQVASFTTTINSDQINSPGGSVTFTAPPANTATVRLQRVQPLTQLTTLPTYGPFPAKTVEKGMDAIVQKVQQIDRDRADLSVTISNIISGGPGAANLIAPTATGATTPITLADWMAFTVNAKSFNVKCDDSTDDTANLQSAATAAAGKMLFIPGTGSGSCYVPGNVTIPANTIVFGTGYGTKIRTSSGSPVFIMGSNTAIISLRIEGPSPGVIKIAGGVSNVKIKQNYFKTVGQVVWIWDATNVNVEDNTFDGTGYGVIQQANFASSHVRVKNNVALNMVSDFVEANCTGTAPSEDWIIDGNQYLGNAAYPTPGTETRFVGITGVKNVSITNNIVRKTTGDAAIHLEDTQGNITINGNTFENCAGVFSYLYLLNSSKDTVITNNTFIQSDLALPATYVLDFSSNVYTNKVIFSNNRVLGNASRTLSGIFLAFKSNTIIEGNYFESLDKAVGVNSSTAVSFVGNRVLNSNHGIFSVDTTTSGGNNDWTVVGNSFEVITAAITVRRNTNGTNPSNRWLINSNTTNGNISMYDTVDCSAIGNTLRGPATEINVNKTQYIGSTGAVQLLNRGVAAGTSAGAIELGSTTFGNLGTPNNLSIIGCSDCTIANPCAGGGTGAVAKRLNGVWVCN